MKHQSLLLLFLLLLAACTTPSLPSPTGAIAPSNIPNPSVTSTSTLVPTLILVPSPSATITPTSTAPQTGTPTPQPTSTPTPTMIPTLAEGDAYARLLELLQTNYGCQLPCWWGIVPGLSTFADAQAQFIPLMGITDFYYTDDGGGFGLRYPVNDLLLDIYLEQWVLPRGNTIEKIYISTQMLRKTDNGFVEVFDSDSYNKILGAYTLSGILSGFGSPSRVLIRAENYGTYPMTEYIFITLIYPEKGVFVRYKIFSERKGDVFSGCPSKAFIDLWLIPPNIGDNYQDILSLGRGWEGDMHSIKPLEEATQMTVDEFYRTFKEPTDICVQTPVNIWPIP
jgi:hypothetical protein